MADSATRRDAMAAAGALLILSASGGRAAERFNAAATVRHLAKATRLNYHDARLGGIIADRLLTALRSRRFDDLNPTALEKSVNEEVAAASRDAHFIVMKGDMSEMRAVPPTEPHGTTLPLTAPELRFLKQENYGFAAAQVLKDNVGLIQIKPQFYRPVREVRERAALAMAFVADTAGLIIDLTETMGGDPNTVALLLSYFLDRPPMVVNRFHWRNLPTEEFRTTADPGGPKYGESRPVAVLVSRSSYSAAEEFAYDMQVLRRGIIVGEKTPGAANHALPVKLVGGFTAFIPMARAENPITRTNWEGSGVLPDVIVSPPTVDAAQQLIASKAH